jgi:hypothetical protein
MTSAAAATQARLQAVIKESRKIMRKDAGLNGELDRLPQLAWLLFLKAFDDLEAERTIMDPAYRPALPETYRWRTWVTDTDRTGDALLVFVNGNLIPALRGLTGTGKAGDTRDTLARVFAQVFINGDPTLWMGKSLVPTLSEKVGELGRYVVGKIVIEHSAQVRLVARSQPPDLLQ